MKIDRSLFPLGFTLMAIALRLPAAELHPAVSAWLAAQTNIQSWSADFVQTRTLKSLTQPLTATGQVWLSRSFRVTIRSSNP